MGLHLSPGWEWRDPTNQGGIPPFPPGIPGGNGGIPPEILPGLFYIIFANDLHLIVVIDLRNDFEINAALE